VKSDSKADNASEVMIIRRGKMVFLFSHVSLLSMNISSTDTPIFFSFLFFFAISLCLRPPFVTFVPYDALSTATPMLVRLGPSPGNPLVYYEH